MKRPLFWIGLVFLSSTAVFLRLSPAVAAVVFVFIAVYCAYLSGKSPYLRRAALLLIVCVFAAGFVKLSAAAKERYLAPIKTGPDQIAIIHGTVIKSYGISGYQTLTVRADILANDNTKTADISLSGYFSDMPLAGDKICCHAKLKGERYIVKELITDCDSSHHIVLSKRIAVQKAAAEKLNALFGGKAGGVISAVLTGDKTNLDDNIVSNFRKCSLSHLLVISGMHLAVICHSIKLLLKPLSSAKLKTTISILFCWLFTAFTGFGISTVRAAIMLTIMDIGDLIERKSDTLTSLITAAVLLTLFSPNDLFSASFLLSFSSVLGIAVLQKPIYNALYNNGGKLSTLAAESVSVAAAAQLATLPVYAVMFKTVPLLGVFANLAAIWLLLPIMLLGALSLILGLLSPVLAFPFVMLCKGLINALLLIANAFSKIPFSNVIFSERWQILWLALSAILLITIFCRFKTERNCRMTAFLISLVFLVMSVFDCALNINRADIIIFEESGCAAVIKGGRAILFGSPQNKYHRNDIENAFTCLGVEKLDAVILNYNYEPNYNTASLCQSYNCDTLCCENSRSAAVFCHSAGIKLKKLPDNANLFNGVSYSLSKTGFEIAFNGAKLLKIGNEYDIIGKYTSPPKISEAVRIRVNI